MLGLLELLLLQCYFTGALGVEAKRRLHFWTLRGVARLPVTRSLRDLFAPLVPKQAGKLLNSFSPHSPVLLASSGFPFSFL